MSAENRLQALEQLMMVMQSDVLLASETAVQAEQRATDAASKTIVDDTRLLGKSKSIGDTSESWRPCKFTFLRYAGAVDMSRKQNMFEKAKFWQKLQS